jgi:hypothetical protein
MKTKLTLSALLVFAVLMSPLTLLAQQNSQEPSPAGALLRSMVLPGWGHYYADSENWNRGKVHLGVDITLLASYFGFRINANRLEGNLFTHSKMYAGQSIDDRGRAFRLNIADFNSLSEYNDYQERTRNWDRFIDNTPENQWHWESTNRRLEFVDLNNRMERNRQQLPAIVSLMVVNRLIAGVNAFTTARNRSVNSATLTLTIPEYTLGNGVQANIRLSF